MSIVLSRRGPGGLRRRVPMTAHGYDSEAGTGYPCDSVLIGGVTGMRQRY